MGKWIEAINEDIRETKKLTRTIQQEITELRKYTDATRDEVREAKRHADAAKSQADASWELVNIIRKDLKRPIWKRWFGIN